MVLQGHFGSSNGGWLRGGCNEGFYGFSCSREIFEIPKFQIHCVDIDQGACKLIEESYS